jgi:hypothetical protein
MVVSPEPSQATSRVSLETFEKGNIEVLSRAEAGVRECEQSDESEGGERRRKGARA